MEKKSAGGMLLFIQAILLVLRIFKVGTMGAIPWDSVLFWTPLIMWSILAGIGLIIYIIGSIRLRRK